MISTFPICFPFAMYLKAPSTLSVSKTVGCSGSTTPVFIPSTNNLDTASISRLSSSNKLSSRMPWNVMFFKNTSIPRRYNRERINLDVTRLVKTRFGYNTDCCWTQRVVLYIQTCCVLTFI